MLNVNGIEGSVKESDYGSLVNPASPKSFPDLVCAGRTNGNLDVGMENEAVWLPRGVNSDLIFTVDTGEYRGNELETNSGFMRCNSGVVLGEFDNEGDTILGLLSSTESAGSLDQE
ncbi:hypothetical protein AgCh_021416 [Apium graveolens]